MSGHWLKKKTSKKRRDTILSNPSIGLEILIKISEDYLQDLNADHEALNYNSGKSIKFERYKA